MPSLSSFYGIIIYMYMETGKKHNVPHIHAEFAEYSAVFDFYGNLIEGQFPSNKRKLVEAWVLIHEDELKSTWNLLSRGEQINRIDPLI